jgi:hypothetical protein
MGNSPWESRSPADLTEGLNPDIWEIMIAGPAAISTKRHSGAGGYHDEVFPSTTVSAGS